MKLIDLDNMRGINIPQRSVPAVQKLFAEGRVLDSAGYILYYEDCIDCQGDLCVDEVAYGQIEEHIRLPNHTRRRLGTTGRKETR